MLIQATFYPIALLTLVFAFLVVTSRNIFHGALYLAFTLIGVACVYLYLNAEFLAIVQVLIYVGAIVTLFIFTIMLTADITTQSFRGVRRRALVSAFAALAIFIILNKLIAKAPWHDEAPAGVSIDLPQLGRSLMSTYALPFEVISLVSLAALVGAIVIGRMDKR